MNKPLPLHQRDRSALLLLALIIIASTIRLLLIFLSGELVHYDGPEYFNFSQKVYVKLATFDIQRAFTTPVFAHWGCILFGTIPFFLKPDWLSQQEISAVFFALPAVINIWLVYRIAVRFRMETREALLAATLYALSFTGIYTVRHVYPHDLALTFFFTGALLTLSANRPRHQIWIGVLQFLCFFTYYGYWTVAFAGLLFAACYQSTSIRSFLTKGVAAATGFFLPLAVFFAIGFGYGINYLDHFLNFSKTITMGSFDEGYLLPFAFLWHADGLLLIIWLVCLLFAWQQRGEPVIRYSVSAIVLIYFLLVAGSNLLQYFVVYGRLVKPVIPMLCLVSACVLAKLDNRKLVILVLSLLPGFASNVWQLHRTTFWADINQAYQKQLRLTPNDRQLLLETACNPPLAVCGAAMRDDCVLRQTFITPENIKYNQYDAVDPAIRPLSAHYRFYYEIRDCPKKQP